MSKLSGSLRVFLDAARACVLVEVADAKGSTPRDKGTWMLVSPDRIFGTIGGGQLEYMAIDKARQMLAGAFHLLAEQPVRGGIFSGAGTSSQAGSTPPIVSGDTLLPRGRDLLSIPLGPEIGQCCGGRVEVGLDLVDDRVVERLLQSVEAEDARMPHLYVFGGGHVGQALASAFALLPVRTIVVETRADALEGMPPGVETRLTPMPEDMVRRAPARSAFVVLTHDHALDFLIVSEALRRNDAAYVGMIGSRTKKTTFRSWFMKNDGGSQAMFAQLVSPIGGNAVKDKRPAVIAALAAAEVIAAMTVSAVQQASST